MVLKPGLIAIAALALLSSFPASAQNDEVRLLHVACDQGDRRACVRFGIWIGEHREKVKEYRRTHPEFFWYER